MKDVIKGKGLYLVGFILVILIILILVIIVKIGSAYKNGLNQLTDQPAPANATHNVKQKINKITLKKGQDDKGCIEVTPDGIVRTYDVCGSSLVSADRMTDSTNINRLFKLAGETDYTSSQNSGQAIDECQGYLMTIETDIGKQTVCMNVKKSGGNGNGNGNGTGNGGNSGNPIDDIIEVIKKVIEDIPPTPTVTPVPSSPSPEIIISGTPEPTAPFIPGDEPTPTPTPVPLKPFTCGYSVDASGKKHPYDVSNIICSELPVPGQ